MSKLEAKNPASGYTTEWHVPMMKTCVTEPGTWCLNLCCPCCSAKDHRLRLIGSVDNYTCCGTIEPTASPHWTQSLTHVSPPQPACLGQRLRAISTSMRTRNVAIETVLTLPPKQGHGQVQGLLAVLRDLLLHMGRALCESLPLAGTLHDHGLGVRLVPPPDGAHVRHRHLPAYDLRTRTALDVTTDAPHSRLLRLPRPRRGPLRYVFHQDIICAIQPRL